MAGRRNSSRSSGQADDYGHKYRVFRVSNDTFKTTAKMVNWCQGTEWFEDSWMYEAPDNGGRGRGRKKKNKILQSTIETRCNGKIRGLKKNITKFTDDVELAEADDVAVWFREKSVGFRPSSQKLGEWHQTGYGVGPVFSLIYKRSVGLRNSLELTHGAWQALLALHDELLRGEIDYNEDNDQNMNDQNMNDHNMDDQNMNNDNRNNDNRNNFNNNLNNNNNNRNNINNNDNNDQNDQKMNDVNIMLAKIKKTNNFHVVKNIARKNDENASNHKQRQRNGRKHPYFREKGDKNEFLILTVDPSAKTLPVITGSTGHQYIYDETSGWWPYDQIMVRWCMLKTHGLKKMHKRVIAQNYHTQHVFRNKRVNDDDTELLRVAASEEFKLSTTASEYLSLIVRVKCEANAYEKNKSLIEADEFKDDYDVGEWNLPYEKRCRLPRSANQIQQLVAQNKFVKSPTVFFFRVDLFKMHAKMTQQEWDGAMLKWKKWKVLDYMREYLAEFFPGKEAEAKEIGLIADDVQEDVNLVQKEADEEKDDDGDLDMI